MKIKSWYLENYKSYGPARTTITLTSGELILVKAPNGSGKCVEKNTFIDINIIDLELNNNLIKYLLETASGKIIYKFIKENNINLYEKIKEYKEEAYKQ